MRSLLAACALAWIALAAPAGAQPDAIADDGDRDALARALDRTRTYLDGLQRANVTLIDREVPVERLRRTAARFSELVRTAWGTPAFEAALKAEFEWVAMPGTDGAGTVHYTGYHLPLLDAREAPDATYRFPLYAPPPDMVRLDLGAFRSSLSGQAITCRIEGGRVLPYFTREEIDDGGKLAGKGLEIAWVKDELARYSLMVQGSGLLRYPDGRIVNVNYASQNGHAYASLGKALVADGVIPQAQISMPAIEAYFKAQPDRMRKYLNRNPSYVFFRTAPDGPFGVSGISLTPGRAIATDKRLFPSGAIAYLEYPRAVLEQGEVRSWETGSRFVVDQDTGGAIVGPGRIDIYWGGGEEAAWRAGTLNGNGRAYYLLLKETPSRSGKP